MLPAILISIVQIPLFSMESSNGIRTRTCNVYSQQGPQIEVNQSRTVIARVEHVYPDFCRGDLEASTWQQVKNAVLDSVPRLVHDLPFDAKRIAVTAISSLASVLISVMVQEGYARYKQETEGSQQVLQSQSADKIMLIDQLIRSYTAKMVRIPQNSKEYGELKEKIETLEKKRNDLEFVLLNGTYEHLMAN